MFPMILDVEELRKARRILSQVRAELTTQNIPHRDVQVGIMIETPSGAITSEALEKEVDFFSLGTNDLIQYYMAVDRTNEMVSNLCDPA